jgi:thiol-disulfide isomerase/thioredoxin
MSKPLTKNPTLLTALLSAATVAGYVAYRFTLGAADTPAGPAAGMEVGHEHAEDEADADLLAQSAPARPGLVDALPAIAFDELDGSRTSLDALTGRPMLINFWATWCAPCLKEIPLLKDFHAEQAGLDVIGIAVDDPEDVMRFAETMEFNYPVLLGLTAGYEAMAVFRNDASAMPFSVFVAPDGAVLGKHYGELDAEQLEHFAATLEALDAGRIDRVGARGELAGL